IQRAEFPGESKLFSGYRKVITSKPGSEPINISDVMKRLVVQFSDISMDDRRSIRVPANVCCGRSAGVLIVVSGPLRNDPSGWILGVCCCCTQAAGSRKQFSEAESLCRSCR